MGLFSALGRPPRPGIDGFLAALRDKLERDRLLAAQVSVQDDPAEAMQIRARSRAIDALRAEAKERAQKARMAAKVEREPGRELLPAMINPVTFEGGSGAFAGASDGLRAGARMPPTESERFFAADDSNVEVRAGLRSWPRNASHRSANGQFAPAALGIEDLPAEFGPPTTVDNGPGFQGQGFDGGRLHLAAMQEGFERQQDRRIAEERARATGRDPDEIHREMRGLGRQGPPHPEPAQNPSGSLPRAAVRELEALAKPEPARVPSAGYVPSAWRPNGTWDADEVNRHAVNAMRMYDVHIAGGMSPIQAAGWAANAEAESGGNYRRPQDSGGPGYGLFQWGGARRSRFQEKFGHPMEQSTEAEQLAFRDFELKHDLQREARLIDNARTAGDHAAAVTHHYEIPRERVTAAADRANLAEAIVALAQARERARRR